MKEEEKGKGIKVVSKEGRGRFSFMQLNTGYI